MDLGVWAGGLELADLELDCLSDSASPRHSQRCQDLRKAGQLGSGMIHLLHPGASVAIHHMKVLLPPLGKGGSLHCTLNIEQLSEQRLLDRTTRGSLFSLMPFPLL